MALIQSGKIPANPYDVIGVNKKASWLLSRIYWMKENGKILTKGRTDFWRKKQIT
jgi:hypothetical protein